MEVRAVDTTEWGHQGRRFEKAGMRGSGGREGPEQDREGVGCSVHGGED